MVAEKSIVCLLEGSALNIVARSSSNPPGDKSRSRRKREREREGGRGR